jgi:hypothetical protein
VGTLGDGETDVVRFVTRLSFIVGIAGQGEARHRGNPSPDLIGQR